MEPPPKNPKNTSNTYQISGVPVKFPYKAYGSQLAFMGRVISTLDRARRDGHCHALLESPTGTGKSLSLLCSSLAWQAHRECFPVGPTIDPLAYGGGFIPEPDASGNVKQVPTSVMTAKARRNLTCPTIYYATRTHGQITQVVREYRKTSYRVPMAILASRKRYCTNKHVCNSDIVDEKCKILLKASNCRQFKNSHKVKDHHSLRKGGNHEVHDIEDLVSIGKEVKGCSYFAAKAMAEEANIVFCPYNYIINPIVRRLMDIDIQGSIIILDEAHNIEDIARDTASLDVEDEVLYTLQAELSQLCRVDSAVASMYQPLYDMIQGIIGWINDRKHNLQKRDFEHYESHWTGDKAVNELHQAGITQQCFPVLDACAQKAIKAVSDAEAEEEQLSGSSAITLEGLFSSLNYFYSGNGCNTLNYQLVLQRYVKREGFVKREANNAEGDWTCSLSLWCLNPAVVFRDIANMSLSVILTSGTLSPMGSFASELGVKFEACMEAPHVIDVESQLWASVISYGPGNCVLNASYKTADGLGFQDSLGASLEEICKSVPGGALIFFPSYKLLEKLRQRWCQTGQWSRLNAQKTIFVEPRGQVEEFEPVLRGYYESVSGKMKTVRGKTKTRRKQPSKSQSTKDSPDTPTVGGAAFLAVCRGKVSEGIDFSDENARAVVIVGIPFPNTNDPHILLKRKYNDTYSSSKGLLSGSEWYCHQAFRALNQALGRCIRHRFDYGAIILLDERFTEQRNLKYVSKWLRASIKQYNSFDESMEGLRTFFQKKQETSSYKEVLQLELLDTDINKESKILSPLDQFTNKVSKKKDEKQKKLNYPNGEKIISGNTERRSTRLDSASLKLTGSNLDPIVVIEEDEEATGDEPWNSDIDCVCLGNNPILTRCSESISVASLNSALNESVVNSSEKDDRNPYSPSSALNQIVDNNSEKGDRNIPSTVVQTCDQLQDQFSLSNMISSGDLPSSTITPKRSVHTKLGENEQESVNSYNQKKRRLSNSNQQCSMQIDGFHSPKVESCLQFDYASDQNGCRSTDHITESPISSESSTEKKLHICCNSCKKSLGLLENDFLITCLMTSSSKVYLSSALEYRRASIESSDSPTNLPKIPSTGIRIITADASSIDQRILCTEAAVHEDVWSEEDGCVFRKVYCPFCTISGVCLGVQVKAVNSSNLKLLNKVLFFSDRLYVKNDQIPMEKVVLPDANSVKKPASSFADIENFEYVPTRDLKLLSARSKLRLPKRTELSSQFQDAHT